MKIDAEFQKDLKDAGREITRCFIRAHIAFDFVGTAVRELTDLRDHMLKMNQGPEALLVDSAIGLLNQVEVTPPDATVPSLPHGENESLRQPVTQRKSSTIEQRDGAGPVGVLPASFFKRTGKKA